MIKRSISHTAQSFIILLLINYVGQTHLCYAGDKKQLTIISHVTNSSCKGQANGRISLDIKGAVEPLDYQWSNGGSGKELEHVSAGDYRVTVTDAKGNFATQSIKVTEPADLEIHGETFAENCSSKDAAIKVQLTGGTKPYSFLWSIGATTKSLEDVAAGDYNLKVTDAEGCIKTTSYNVERTRNLNVQVNTFNPVCSNEANGLIDLEVKGGWAPYTFTWSTGATTEDISGLAAGNYSVWVRDNNGCASRLEMNLKNPSPIQLKATVKDADENKSNGNILLEVSGGSGTYNYLWSTLDAANALDNLDEGVYAVKVTDANQCMAADYYTVHEKSGMEIQATVFNNLCIDDNSGMIDVTVTGGTPPYHYQWSNGEETQDIRTLEAGLYMLIVTDARQQQVSKTYSVQEAESINVFATVKDESAVGRQDGKIVLEILGGAAPYTMEWNTGAKQNEISQLAAGMYAVTITDKNQCKTIQDVMVSTESDLMETSNTSEKMLRLSKDISRNNSSEIAIYPNPFNNSFTIRFATPISNIQRVELFSTEGKLMQSISSNALHLNANQLTVSNITLAKGNYFVKVTTADKTFSKIVTRNL